MRSARSPRSRLAAVTVLVTLIALGAPVTAAGRPAGDGGGHRRPCTGSRPPERRPARDVLRIVERARADMDLTSVILRVALGGTRPDVLLRRKVLRPLGLHETRDSFTPVIPAPVLHAFASYRGRYEESTFWNPSWTTAAPNAVRTTAICDVGVLVLGDWVAQHPLFFG